MQKQKRVAVVTGANRGIGFEICRQLAKQDILVVITSRSEEKGLKACEVLHKEELPVRFHKLDVDHAASVAHLCDFLAQEFGRCDILINNAAIFPDSPDERWEKLPSIFNTQIEAIRRAMETNVYGPILLCRGIVPLMKKQSYGRIVNLSSGMGQLSEMEGGCPAYRLTKTAINAVTRILANELKEENILVNSMCPGWVRTDMGGPLADRDVSEGADTAIWLATLSDNGPRGKLFRDRKEIAW